jgi:hypothetical protein
MSESAVSENGLTPAARMGKAIIKGAIIGVPTALIGITLAVWLITPLDVVDSFVTAILPGILTGVFGGGFAGMASTMEE